jgi:hypothetical protein
MAGGRATGDIGERGICISSWGKSSGSEYSGLPSGEKTGIVQKAIEHFAGPFHFRELQKNCPGVSPDMIRKVLKNMRTEKKLECLGRGKHARWQRIG